MAEVTETNELFAIIILKYKLLIKFYTNESHLIHKSWKLLKNPHPLVVYSLMY